MRSEEGTADSAAIARGDLVSAVGGVLLLALMFFTAWYGIDQLPSRSSAGAARATSENAWHALSLVRWVMLLTVVVAISAAIVHATQRSHGAKTRTGIAVTSLAALTALLLVYRVLIAFPTPDQVVDQKLGAMLGLLAALGMVVGGFATARAERSSSRAGAQRVRAGDAVGAAAGRASVSRR